MNLSKDPGKVVYETLSKIIDYKNSLGLPAKWNRNYELAQNKHWKRKTKKAALISANLLFAHRQKTVNMLTGNNPTFNIAHIGQPHNDEILEGIQHAIEHWWIDQEQQHVLDRTVNKAEMYGCAVEKVIFDPDLEFGLGEVAVEVIDPYYFGVWPLTVLDIQKAEAVFHFKPMSVEEAKRKFPGKKIIPDTEFLKKISDNRREVMEGKSQKGYLSTVARVVKNVLNLARTRDTDDEVVIVECWVKDYTIVTEETEDGIIKRPKYTGFIRCITTCNGGEIILADRSNPSINPNISDEQASLTYLYDKFPFALVNSMNNDTHPYGDSDYQQLEQLNIEIDKTLTMYTMYKDRASRLKIINPRDSGVPNSAFTNAPGIINPNNTATSSGIRYMTPPAPPVDLINAMNVYKEFFFTIAGTFELEQASTPGRNVIAYKAIAALLQHAATMMQGKIRNYEKLIRERGRMYVSHLINWYTEDRYIPYQQDGEQKEVAVNGSQVNIPIKVTVVNGSTMPRAEVQERDEAISLFQMGAIDVQALLQKLDYPGWQDVLKRVQLGQVGQIAQKLQAVGVPQQLLQYFTEVATAKDLSKITPFQQVVQALEHPQEDPNAQKAALELEELQAKAKKTLAEAELLIEKIASERVDQQVKMEGTNFDKEKLKIERAKVVADLKLAQKDMIPTAQSFNTQGMYGIESDNKEI